DLWVRKPGEPKWSLVRKSDTVQNELWMHYYGFEQAVAAQSTRDTTWLAGIHPLAINPSPASPATPMRGNVSDWVSTGVDLRRGSIVLNGPRHDAGASNSTVAGDRRIWWPPVERVLPGAWALTEG